MFFMTLNRFFNIALIVTLLSIPCYAQENLANLDEENVPVLTEELRKMRENDLWEKDGDETQLKDAEPIDMQSQGFVDTGEAKGLVIENRTADPTSPTVGRIWYRSDL